MPITVEQKYGFRLGLNSAEVLYLVRGTQDPTEARTELLAQTDSALAGLVREDAEVEEVDGRDAWLALVRYKRPDTSSPPPEAGGSSFAFDTGGGTQHVTQSLQTIASYAPPGATAPSFQGAIGATRDSVEGVDITVPVYTFSETHAIDPAAVTDAYKGTLFALTGRTNNALFRGFAAGECLFLGAAGSQRGDEAWEVTYRFAASPNKTGLAVGSITGIAKKGWEYLWVLYEDAEDLAAQRLVKKPLAAYVERVYESGDFSLLGIGT